ncbi:MAG: restriction endonuclease subunit S, partial [Dehalococcoidales bacterium]
FCLPSVENQKKFVDLIWKLENLKTKLVMELENLNLLIKSQFIKMFGDLSINDKSWKSDKLSNVLVIERGGSPRPIDDYITNEETGLNWIKIGDANDNSIYIDSVKEKIKPEGLKKTRRVYPDDLILSNSMSFGKPYILKISGCIHDGWLVLHDENDIFDKIFLCYALGNSSTTKKFKSMARGAVVNNLNKKIVGSLEIILPPRNLQNQFADFVKQVDKSKLDSEFDLINLYQNHYFCNAGVLI